MKNFKFFYIPILALLFYTFNVNAEVITPAGGWVLNPYQYVEIWNSTGSKYTNTSADYGYATNSYGQVYRIGAFIDDNGGCTNDYCLQPNSSYVVTFNYQVIGNLRCENLAYYKTFLDISYYNATGSVVSVHANDYASNTTTICSGNNFSVTTVISIPDFGENFSHIKGIDLWYDNNPSSYADFEQTGIFYASGNTTRIGLFSISVTTDVTEYLKQINSDSKLDNIGGAIGDTNDKLDDIGGAIGDTNDKLDDTNDKLDDIGGAIGDTNDKLDDTNDKLDNLEDSLTSETPPDKLGDLNDSAGWLPAGPVDSLLNLPFTMLRNINNNLGGSCQPVTLTLPYVNSNITLPCLSTIYASIDGLSVWINTISIIASGFILYSYLLKLYKWVDDTLTFRENNNIDNWGGL